MRHQDKRYDCCHRGEQRRSAACWRFTEKGHCLQLSGINGELNAISKPSDGQKVARLRTLHWHWREFGININALSRFLLMKTKDHMLKEIKLDKNFLRFFWLLEVPTKMVSREEIQNCTPKEPLRGWMLDLCHLLDGAWLQSASTIEFSLLVKKTSFLLSFVDHYLFILFTGGAGAGEANFKVLEFLKSTKEWTPVGRLKRWRRYHGISVTDKDITKYCL